jgi:hypothetical protein
MLSKKNFPIILISKLSTAISILLPPFFTRRARTSEKIGFVYEFVDKFSEGLAEVGLNGHSGFINKAGKVQIPLDYEEVEPFMGGLSLVKKNGKTGIVNKMGKVVVPFLYEEIHDFSEGLAVVMKGEKYGYIEKAYTPAPRIFLKASP